MKASSLRLRSHSSSAALLAIVWSVPGIPSLSGTEGLKLLYAITKKEASQERVYADEYKSISVGLRSQLFQDFKNSLNIGPTTNGAEPSLVRCEIAKKYLQRCSEGWFVGSPEIATPQKDVALMMFMEETTLGMIESFHEQFHMSGERGKRQAVICALAQKVDNWFRKQPSIRLNPFDYVELLEALVDMYDSVGAGTAAPDCIRRWSKKYIRALTFAREEACVMRFIEVNKRKTALEESIKKFKALRAKKDLTKADKKYFIDRIWTAAKELADWGLGWETLRDLSDVKGFRKAKRVDAEELLEYCQKIQGQTRAVIATLSSVEKGSAALSEATTFDTFVKETYIDPLVPAKKAAKKANSKPAIYRLITSCLGGSQVPEAEAAITAS